MRPWKNSILMWCWCSKSKRKSMIRLFSWMKVMRTITKKYLRKLKILPFKISCVLTKTNEHSKKWMNMTLSFSLNWKPLTVSVNCVFPSSNPTTKNPWGQSKSYRLSIKRFKTFSKKSSGPVGKWSRKSNKSIRRPKMRPKLSL